MNHNDAHNSIVCGGQVELMAIATQAGNNASQHVPLIPSLLPIRYMGARTRRHHDCLPFLPARTHPSLHSLLPPSPPPPLSPLLASALTPCHPPPHHTVPHYTPSEHPMPYQTIPYHAFLTSGPEPPCALPIALSPIPCITFAPSCRRAKHQPSWHGGIMSGKARTNVHRYSTRCLYRQSQGR